MKIFGNISTELKVGILIILGAVAVVYSTTLTNVQFAGTSDNYRIDLISSNISGIRVGSPVSVAGIKIGSVKNIELVEGQALVSLDIKREFTLYSNASMSINSFGILGDKFISVNPGTSDAPALKDGAVVYVPPAPADFGELTTQVSGVLENLQSITQTLENVITSDIGRRDIEGLLTDISSITANFVSITAAIDQNMSALMANLSEISGDIKGITAASSNPLNETLQNMASLTESLSVITEQNSVAFNKIINDLSKISASLAKNVPEVSEGLRSVVSESSDNLNQSIEDLSQSMASLNRSMQNIEEVTARVERGEGSVGMLLNDDTTTREINETLENINEFIDDINSIELGIGGYTQYMSSYGSFKSFVDLRLQPSSHRYYMIELVHDPRGNSSTRTVVETDQITGAVTSSKKIVETSDKLSFSLIVNQRFYDTVFGAGLIENSFGLRAEQFFDSDDQFSMGLRMWDFSNTDALNLDLWGFWNFYSGAFVKFGGYNLISKQRGFFVGLGLRFGENSLKSVAGSLSSAVAQ